MEYFLMDLEKENGVFSFLWLIERSVIGKYI